MKRTPIHIIIIKMNPCKCKGIRVAELMEIQQNISAELNETQIGKVIRF